MRVLNVLDLRQLWNKIFVFWLQCKPSWSCVIWLFVLAAPTRIQEAQKQQPQAWPETDPWRTEVIFFCLIHFIKNTCGLTKRRNYTAVTFVIVKILTFVWMCVKGLNTDMHKLAYRKAETDANARVKPGVGAGQSPAGYSKQHWCSTSEPWTLPSMSCSGVCVWWIISSFTPGKLYSTAAHKKEMTGT